MSGTEAMAPRRYTVAPGLCALTAWALLALVDCGDEGGNPVGTGDDAAGGVLGPGPSADLALAAAFPDSALAAAVAEEMSASGVDSAILLTQLDASGRGLWRLRGLTHLRGLRFLDVSANQLTSLDSVGALDSLEALDLSFNQVVDLGPLADLTRLRVLSAESNRVADLAPVLDLPALEHLDVTGNPLSGAAQAAYVAALAVRGVEVLADPLEVPEESDEDTGAPDGPPSAPVTLGPADWQLIELQAARSLAVDVEGRIYAGTSRAGGSLGVPEIARSADGGATWETLDLPAGGSGAVDAIAVDPQEPRNAMAHAGVSGYVRSDDGGQHWQKVAGLPWGLASHYPVIQEEYLVALGGVGRFYLITPNGPSLHASPDGGVTWEQISSSARAATLHPTGVLYFATWTDVYRSLDGGQTRERLTPRDDQVLALAVDPADAAHLFAATTSGLSESRDGGGTWARTLDPADGQWGAARIRIDPLRPERIWLIAGGRLPDGFKPEPARTYYDALERSLLRSRDGGATWEDVSTQVPAAWDVVFSPTDPGRLYLATDEGVVAWSR